MTVHFVGFPDPRRSKPTRDFISAVRIFGQPDFIHVMWDGRAQAEIFEGDIVVFAQKVDPSSTPSKFSFDDSGVF